MQLYFVKATYTNNVYQISDFFTNNKYKTPANSMLDINFKPDEGATSFITNKIKLPNGSYINNYTHFIIPSFDKIYRIIAIDYLNIEQWKIHAEEDPFLSNYQTLKDTDIILQRTNDVSLFKGINDVTNVSLERKIETRMITSKANTGKWLLIFMQYNPDKEKYGFKFDKSLSSFGPDITKLAGLETFASLDDVKIKYPEKLTATPNAYAYFQKYVYVGGDIKAKYQCVYYNNRLTWSKIIADLTDGELYYQLTDWQATQLNSSDIRNIIFALPFNSKTSFMGWPNLATAGSFISSLDPGEVLDIKLVDDLILPIKRQFEEMVDGEVEAKLWEDLEVDGRYSGACAPTRLYDNDGNYDGVSILTIFNFRKEIDLTPYFITLLNPITPLKAEPFNHYRLYVYGQEFSIPYILTNKIKMIIAPNSGSINYVIYYDETATNGIVSRNVIGSSSFTHSVRWQIDKLDEFYNQNPTYREQYFANMIARAIKGVVTGTIGGAISGSFVPAVGTAIGAGVGLAASVVSAGLDAGIGAINLHLEEKGKRLMPDQIHGDNADLGIQLAERFGIYWKKLESTASSIMQTEYDLKGFPTAVIKKIDNLTKATNSIFGSCKIVYGEIKKVIRNDYATRFINKKLTEGVVIIE